MHSICMESRYEEVDYSADKKDLSRLAEAPGHEAGTYPQILWHAAGGSQGEVQGGVRVTTRLGKIHGNEFVCKLFGDVHHIQTLTRLCGAPST